MKHYLDLVSISNKVHRRQSRMTRICIVLAVFLVAVMFGLADMYLKSMTDETRHQTGDWHCKITAIDEKTSEYIAARPEIDLSGWQGNIPAEIGCTVADQPVSVAGMDETIFSEIYLGSVLSGEFPEIAGQVAVSSTLAQTAGISLGDTLTLNSPDGSTMQLAIMENAFMPKEWSPELSIVSDTNTCSIPADRRDAVVQNSAVSRVCMARGA